MADSVLDTLLAADRAGKKASPLDLALARDQEAKEAGQRFLHSADNLFRQQGMLDEPTPTNIPDQEAPAPSRLRAAPATPTTPPTPHSGGGDGTIGLANPFQNLIDTPRPLPADASPMDRINHGLRLQEIDNRRNHFNAQVDALKQAAAAYDAAHADPDQVDAATDPAALERPAEPGPPLGLVGSVRAAGGGLVSGGGEAISGMANASDAAIRLLGRLANKVGAGKAFDILMAPARWSGVNDIARSVGGGIESAGGYIDVPESQRTGVDYQMASMTGLVGGQILLAWTGGGEASATAMVGQGFEHMAKLVKAKGGEGTVGGDVATLSGGAVMGLLANANVVKLLHWVPPALQDTVKNGLIDVMHAGGRGAAIGAAIQMSNNIAIKLGVDPNQDIMEGVGQNAAVMGLTDAMLRAPLKMAGVAGPNVGRMAPGDGGAEYGEPGGPRGPYTGGGAAPDLTDALRDPDGTVKTFGSHREAALYSAQNSLGGSHDLRMTTDGQIILTQRTPAGTPSRPQGVVEAAEASVPPPTPADDASPLPTDLIAQGRATMARATAQTQADAILSQHGAPPTGTQVKINFGNRVEMGTVEDGFVTNDGRLGQNAGIKVRLANGAVFDEYFDTIHKAGITIESAQEPAPEIATEDTSADPAAPPVRTASRRPLAPASASDAGDGGSVDQYLALTRRAESPNDTAKNPLSSASGRYQFIDSTFRQYYQRVYGSDPGVHPSAALKNDPAVQERLIRAFTQDNANALQRAGVEVTNATLYAAHHFGAAGAIEMGRHPDASVDPKVASANPALRGMTNGEALAWAARHLGGGGSAMRGPFVTTETGPDGEETTQPISRPPEDDSWLDVETTPAPDALTVPAKAPPASASPTAAPTAPAPGGDTPSARGKYPELDRTAAPEDAARRLATDLLSRGFDNTNGIGPGYSFATRQSGLVLPGGERPPKDNITVEIATPTGRQTFSFPKSQLPAGDGSTAAADIRAPAPMPLPRIEDTPSGKGLVISNVTPEHVAAIRDALPANASIVPSNSGTYSVSKKYQDQVRAALQPAMEAAPAATTDSPLPAAAPPAVTPVAAGGPSSVQPVISRDIASLPHGEEASTIVPTLPAAMIDTLNERITRLESDGKGALGSLAIEPREADDLRSRGVTVLPGDYLPKAYIEAVKTVSANPTVQTQPDLLGGPDVTAHQLDAQRDAPKLVEAAKAADTLPALREAVDYVLNPDNTAGDKVQSVRELAQAIGPDIAFDGHAEATAYALALQREIAPQARAETAAPAGGGAPASGSVSEAGAEPPPVSSVIPADAKVADQPTVIDKPAFTRTWMSKSFKDAMKAIEPSLPHRESPVAAASVAGWIDGKAGNLPALRYEAQQALKGEAATQPTGFNPRQGYIEAYHAAATGNPVPVRVRAIGKNLGVREALAALDPAVRAAAPSAPAAPARPILNHVVSADREGGQAAIAREAALHGKTVEQYLHDLANPPVPTGGGALERALAADKAPGIATPQLTPDEKAALTTHRDVPIQVPAERAAAAAILKRGRLAHDPDTHRAEAAVLAKALETHGTPDSRKPSDGATDNNRSGEEPPKAERAKPEEPSAGADNRVFTKEAYEAAKARMRERMNRVSSGIDPTMLLDGITMAGYHLEAGARSFAAYAKAMVEDLGPKIVPNLRSFYEAIRHDPRAEAWSHEMSSPEEIGAALARLEDNAKSGKGATVEEQANAGTTQGHGASTADRAGDAGAGPRDVQGAQGDGRASPDSQGPGGRGEGDLRPAMERGGAEGVVGEPKPDRAAEGAGGDAGAKPSRRGGDRTGRRVRGGDRGLDYVAPRGTLTRSGGWHATADRNLDIIDLVNRLDAEHRPATPEEQALLAKFTGWGAGELRNNLFRTIIRDPETGERSIAATTYGEWKDTINRARELLTGDALEQALQSTQYAHYTSEPVVRGMWDAMERFGFSGGRIMEPGMGIGLFAVAAPKDVIADSSYTGIELDAFSAKIAQYLLPQQNALHADFVKQKLPDGFFDVAIGNPPFSNSKVLDDPAYKRERLSLHDYFFAKTIDKVRPGGLMVFVTSRFTMDKLADRGRQYLADRADLLGAIRLPQTAFKENAGTEVVTDILFFQRRMPDAAPGGEAWLKVEPVKVGEHSYPINEYFARNPAMVLGKHASTGSMYGKNEYTVEPHAGGDIAGHLANAINGLPKDVYTEPVEKGIEAAKAKTWEADMRPSSEKEGGLYVKDGQVFIRESGVGKPLSAFETIKPADEAWLKNYAGVRDALKAAQRDQLHEGEWSASLKALNTAYDAFVKQHGPIQATTLTERKSVDEDGNETVVVYRRLKNQKLLDLDVESPLIFGLEKVADDGTVTKGQFLLGRTLNKPTRPKIESVQDAQAVALDELGRLDLDYIAKLMGQDRGQVIESLGDGIYHVPGGVWQTRDEYLSGDVLAKLEEAKAAADVDPKYERNVSALQKVQPKPLGPQDISIKLGAGWIPVDIVKQFAKDVAGVSNAETLVYEPATAEWGMEGKGGRSSRSAAEEYGTEDRSPQEIMLAVLNNQTIKITRKNSDGTTFTDQTATAAANDAATKLSDKFRTWAWEDVRRASTLLDLYNRKFNNLAPRRFDGSHLTFPGLSAKYSLYDHQKTAVWRQIQTGNTYLAHAVGAGKTLEMIVGGMEQKRLGLIKKPMFAVPNHMLAQFAREFMEAYPAASIMVADEHAFHTDNRKRFMAQAALNAPDAIIITHSSFGKLGTSPESRAAVVKKMIEELEIALKASETRYTVAKIEKQIEALKRTFESKTGSGKDQALTFEEMGVDYLYVDEAHLFRKLDYATNRNVKGIDPKGSQRALDLYIKTRWLEQQRPGRSLTLASGTPVTNTMAEIYTVMRYMDEKGLERDGLRAFDAWANMFGEVAAGYEQNAAGGYEIVERFAKFINVPELMKRVRTFMDVLTSDNLGDLVKRPKVNGGGPQSVVTPPIDSLREYMQGELKARIEASRKWKPSKDEPANPDPIIAINTDARLASIDMRFIHPDLPNDPGSKLNKMIDRIIERQAILKHIGYINPATGSREMVRGGTQIVFSAVGFGEGAMKNRGFDLRGWMDNRLMKEAGLKRPEIAWMSDANSHAKKEALFKDMRSGKVRVLVGSPANMGTGVNVQTRLKALHYLAPPWYPADVEQPHGRIVRQGNWNDDVDLYWYATKGTYDSTAWGMVSRKARFIEQAMSGDDSVRSLDDISEANQYEMASALAAGDERIIQIAGYTSDIERMTRLQGAHAQEQHTLAHDERWQRKALEAKKAEIADLEAAVKARSPGAPFEMTVDGTSFDKPGEAGAALVAAIQRELDQRQAIPTMKLATYQGHAIGIEPESRGKASGFVLTATVGPLTVPVTRPMDSANELDPVGVATRVQNAVGRLPADLRTAQSERTDIETELKKIERKLGAPFPQEQQLAERIADRANLQAQLAAETAAAETARATTPNAVAEPGEKFYPAGDGQQGAEQPLRRDTDAVSARRGGSVRALGVASEIQREGSAAFVGRTVEKPGDLAEVAQVYRDPRYETFRVFLMKGSEIVHATGVSARLPGVAPLMPKNLPIEQFHAWLRTAMQEAGADGYYLLHNHPSGDPTPSSNDMAVTVRIVEAVPGYRGHVIINSNKYAVIAPDGGVKVIARNFGPDKLLQPAKPHPVLGAKVSSASELVAIGKAIQQPGFVTLVAADARLTVRAIVDYPEAELGRSPMILLGALRRVMRQSGSTSMFLVGSREALNSQPVMDALRKGVLVEAVDENGAGSRTTAYDPSRSMLDKTQGAFVSEEHGVAFDKDTEERFQAARSGIGDGPGLIERAKGWWGDIATAFSRHWKALPNEPRFSDVQQQLRKLEAAPEAATEETVRRLTSMVKGMSRSDFDLFTRKVVLDDLQWEVSNEHKLPFGFTAETLAVARAQVDEALAGNTGVADAVRRRKLLNRQLADEMVAAGVLTAEQIRNPAYYRHMVLDFARAEMRAAHTPGNKIKSPYWAKRMGSSLDINANLLEAEFDWTQKAQVDIATARVIDWIKESPHNIRDKLIQQAKDANKEAVDALVKADTSSDGEKGEIAKADLYFRQLVARGLEGVQKELLDGNLDPIPSHLQAAADAIASGKKEGGPSPFPFLAWILDNNKAGADAAAMALKGVGQRKAWTRDLLGAKYHDPEDMQHLVEAFAPDGYAAWQPIEGQHMFTAKTISESALDMFVGKLADTAMPGLNHDELARALGSIRDQLVTGGDRYTMIVPEEIAATLNEFGDRRGRSLVAGLFGGIQSAWKRWMLINPRRIIKYNLNNMTGDLDALVAGNPGALRRVGEAARELDAVMRRKETPSPRYAEAVERGVFSSGLSIQEIPDINRLSSLRHLSERPSRRPDKVLVMSAGALWRAAQGFTQWRENIFRYAAYLDYADKLEAGQKALEARSGEEGFDLGAEMRKLQAKIGYGASVPGMVDAVTDNRDKAALLARDLLGDYGSISTAGSWLRRYLIPFWSWTEINTKRYWRLTSNVYRVSKARGIATGGILGAGMAARVAVGLLLRMAAVYGTIWLWNHLLHGDDEKKLGDMQGDQLHLILGHNAKGEVMTLRMQGALSDVMGELGFPDAVKGVQEYLRGQGSIADAIKNTLKAPLNKVATGISPLFGIPFLELPSGTERWPDMFNPRPIHDRARHVAKAVSLDNEYDALTGAPSRGYGRSWAESVVYKRDPGEIAFEQAKGLAYDWLAKQRGETGSPPQTARGEALRNYRMAIRFGDPTAANKALDEYGRLGGTAKSLRTSVKEQNPLGPIPKKDRAAFVQSLTDDQYEMLVEADRYYRETYLPALMGR